MDIVHIFCIWCLEDELVFNTDRWRCLQVKRLSVVKSSSGHQFFRIVAANHASVATAQRAIEDSAANASAAVNNKSRLLYGLAHVA